MRGKHVKTITDAVVYRNIPAYAGKTGSGQPIMELDKEHPRVCGENGFILIGQANCFGTSPRMRGKLEWQIRANQGYGNIPAYAGKTP